MKKILKYENNNNREKITICVSFFKISERLFVGKNPPEEIIVKAKFNELRYLTDKKFRIIKMNSVKPEYSKKILNDCFKTSELLKDRKLVRDFLKFSS